MLTSWRNKSLGIRVHGVSYRRGRGSGMSLGNWSCNMWRSCKDEPKYKRVKSQKPSNHAIARISRCEISLDQSHVVPVWSRVQETVETPGARSRINNWIAWKTNKDLLHVSHSHPHAIPRLFKHLRAPSTRFSLQTTRIPWYNHLLVHLHICLQMYISHRHTIL